MEEAQRLLTVSVWKLYRCRLRRGGLRLHRSLQLSLLVRAARNRYLSARAAAGTVPVPTGETAEPSGDPRNAPGANGENRAGTGTGQERGNRTGENRAGTGTGQERGNRTGESPNRAGTEQERGNLSMDWTGQNPNRASPGSERDRGYPPDRPTEPSPNPRTGDSPAPDPPNRARDPPSAAPGPVRSAGTPRAGQKRRSSGSAGPGPGPVPSKRARLEAEAPPVPPGPPGRCSGPPAAAFGFLVRAVGAC